MFTQSLLLRAGLYGQRLAELETGLLLAGWLLASGVGAALGSRLRRPRVAWAAAAVAMAPLAAGGILAMRAHLLPSVVCVLPAGLAAGVLFIQPFDRLPATRAYMLEAAGAVVGGLLFLLLSQHLLDTGMVAAALLLTGLALPTASPLSAAIPAAAAAALALPGVSSGISSVMERGLPEGDTSTSASPYGEVSVVIRDGEPAVYLGGVLVGAGGTPETSETAAVVPLLLSEPSHVVYMGYDTGTAELIAGWPGVETVTVVALAKEALVGGRLPPEVQVVEADGRSWLRRMEGDADLVIVEGGLPLSLATNRFYTREMMRLARNRLSSNGMLSFGFHVGENRMLPAGARLVRGVLSAGEDVFASAEAVPLGGVRFLFSRADQLPLEGAELARELSASGAETVWLTPGTLEFELSEWRLDDFRRQLDVTAAENRDLRPEAVETAEELWRLRMGEEGGNRTASLILLGACAVALAAALLSGPGLRPRLSVASLGLGQIAAETSVILVIQSTLGYSYALVGLVSASAMAGLAAGAWLAGRGRLSGLGTVHTAAVLAVAMLAGSCALYDAGVLASAPLAFLALASLLALGTAAGGQFPLAADAIGGGRRSVGALEMADLSGSAVGGVILPVVLFGALGATLSLLAVAGVMGLALAALKTGEARRPSTR